jgi:hypothetical protein
MIAIPNGGKPQIVLDHISIAPKPGGGVSVCVTLTVLLDDAQALDMVMRAIGTIARARGHSETIQQGEAR